MIDPRRTRSGAWVSAGAFLLLAFVVLYAWAGPPHPGGDPGRDLLIARDCVELHQCALVGPKTTVGELHQGVVWHAFIVAVLFMGGDLWTLQIGVWLLMAGSVALWCAVVGALRSAREGIVAAALLLVLFMAGDEHTRIWNPSLLPLFAVVATASMWTMARSGRALLGAAVGLFVGLGVNVHVGFAVLLGPAVFLAARVPRAALCSASLGAAFAIGAYAGGPLAAERNLRWALDAGAFWALLGALTLCLGLGLWARRRTLPTDAALLGGILLPFAASAVGLASTGHAVRFDYFHPVLPALALAAAMAENAITRRAPERARNVVAALALTGLVVTALTRPQSTGWPLRTLERLAPVVYAEMNHAEARRHVQGPRCAELVDGLAMFSPATNGEARASRAMLVVPSRGEAPPGTRDVGGAFVRTLDSAIDWRGAEVCHVGRERVCWNWQPDPRETDPLLLASRAYPHAHPLRSVGPHQVEWNIPVQSARVLSLPPGDCWRFSDGSTERRMERAGRVEVRADGECDDHSFFPCLVETRPEEEALRALLVWP